MISDIPHHSPVPPNFRVKLPLWGSTYPQLLEPPPPSLAHPTSVPHLPSLIAHLSDWLGLQEKMLSEMGGFSGFLLCFQIPKCLLGFPSLNTARWVKCWTGSGASQAFWQEAPIQWAQVPACGIYCLVNPFIFDSAGLHAHLREAHGGWWRLSVWPNWRCTELETLELDWMDNCISLLCNEAN